MGDEPDPRSATATSLIASLREAASFQDGSDLVLRTVCVDLGWDVGILWTRAGPTDNAVRFAGSWHAPGVDECELERLSARSTFPPGVGLPGRVFASREPAWIPDAQLDHSFPRKMAAIESGIHAAFAIPIMDGRMPLGIVEFFSHEVRPLDMDLLRMLAPVGDELGRILQQQAG